MWALIGAGVVGIVVLVVLLLAFKLKARPLIFPGPPLVSNKSGDKQEYQLLQHHLMGKILLEIILCRELR